VQPSNFASICSLKLIERLRQSELQHFASRLAISSASVESMQSEHDHSLSGAGSPGYLHAQSLGHGHWHSSTRAPHWASYAFQMAYTYGAIEATEGLLQIRTLTFAISISISVSISVSISIQKIDSSCWEIIAQAWYPVHSDSWGCRYPILLPSIFMSPSHPCSFSLPPPLPPTRDRIKASTPSRRSARRIHRLNQYAIYATHRSRKPAYQPEDDVAH